MDCTEMTNGELVDEICFMYGTICNITRIAKGVTAYTPNVDTSSDRHVLIDVDERLRDCIKDIYHLAVIARG